MTKKIINQSTGLNRIRNPKGLLFLGIGLVLPFIPLLLGSYTATQRINRWTKKRYKTAINEEVSSFILSSIVYGCAISSISNYLESDNKKHLTDETSPIEVVQDSNFRSYETALKYISPVMGFSFFQTPKYETTAISDFQIEEGGENITCSFDGLEGFKGHLNLEDFINKLSKYSSNLYASKVENMSLDFPGLNRYNSLCYEIFQKFKSQHSD